MTSTSRKGFILTTKIYKKTNNAAILGPKKNNIKGKASVKPEGMAVQKNNKNNKKTSDTEIHTNEIHTKLGHPVEYRLRVTTRNLHYRIEEAI